MAVADFIKAFSLSESSLRSSSTSTTTQVVGLLSVLAISGSVALFTLAANKHRDAANADAAEPLKLEDSDVLTKSAPLEMNGRYRLMRAGEAASQPLKINGKDGLITAMELASAPSKMYGGDAVQDLQSVNVCRKRVRFADDVVEPRGNGQEYRMRFAQRQHEEGVEGGKRHVHTSNSMPANRIALYKGLRQHRLQHSASSFS